MDAAGGAFNLHGTILAIAHAFYAIFCHVFFDAALHGLGIAVVFALFGFVLFKRSQRFGKPLMSVARRLSIFCLVLLLPGALSLLFAGHLPSTGVFSINSMGFIGFWSLICVHLSAEEMNHQWF